MARSRLRKSVAVTSIAARVNHHFLDIFTLHKPASGRVSGSWLPPGPGHVGLDKGSLSDGGAGDGRHAPYLNRWHNRSLARELLSKRVDQGSVREALTHTAQQHGQPFGSLGYLPSTGGYGVHHAVKYYRLHRDPPPGRCREAQHVLDATLDPVYEGEGAPTGTVRRRGRPQAVAHLVADQGHRAREQHRDEYLVSVDARWHRPVLLVDHLGDHQILEEVHAPVLLTLRCDSSRLGRRVHLERFLAPGFLDASPRLLCKDLRTAEDEARGDA